MSSRWLNPTAGYRFDFVTAEEHIVDVRALRYVYTHFHSHANLKSFCAWILSPKMADAQEFAWLPSQIKEAGGVLTGGDIGSTVS